MLSAVDSIMHEMRAGSPVVPAVATGMALGLSIFVVAGGLSWAWFRYRRKL